MPDLVLVFLLVSCVSLVFQALAFIRLAARRARTSTEELVGGGYLRTIACRVLAATIYVVVAAIQFAGAGSLSAEALIVFTSVQGLWICNSLLDIRIRRTLSQQPGGLMPADRPGDQLASIAAVADDLDHLIDRLFANVAELKVILARTEPGEEADPP